MAQNPVRLVHLLQSGQIFRGQLNLQCRHHILKVLHLAGANMGDEISGLSSTHANGSCMAGKPLSEATSCRGSAMAKSAP